MSDDGLAPAHPGGSAREARTAQHAARPAAIPPLLASVVEVQVIEWPDQLPGCLWIPAYHAAFCRALDEPPPGVVIHSGAEGAGTAEWAWRREAQYFAHFAWSTTHRQYVQTCSLKLRAPHAGEYNGWVGIEMPGPWHGQRSAEQRAAIRALVEEIRNAVPSVTRLTGHQWIDHAKRDPGPGVTADWWDGLGLEVHWRWVGRALLVPG